MSSLLDTFALLKSKLNSKAVFILVIRNGEIRPEKGSPHLKFKRECEDVVKELGLTKGHIIGIQLEDGKIKIDCSKSIPATAAQRFRNVWSFYS